MKMVDIHCHLLPGIDDGPTSWEETLQMCETAAADGITHIVATPHCNDHYRYDRQAALVLLEELARRVPKIAFSLGCDFHLSYDNIEDAKRHPEQYTIGKTKYLLVELSEYSVPISMTTVFSHLSGLGLVPIITHPERNSLLEGRFELIEKWISVGCLVQVTAGSLTGQWGSGAKKFCEKLLKNEQVHAIATDAHDRDHRPLVLSVARRAAAKLVGEKYAQALCSDIPAAIVRGEELELSRVWAKRSLKF
jgi:protein-tyrosine phosphatase